MLIRNECCSGNVVATTLCGEDRINNARVYQMEPTTHKQSIDVVCVCFVEGGHVYRVGYYHSDSFVCFVNQIC